MYLPPHFKEERLSVLHQAIHDIGLATLVTFGTAGLEASHVPLLLDTTTGTGESAPYGTLYGHLARGNRQLQRAISDAEALAIFLGPASYVSPSWYPTKVETGKVVPTWNYMTVHAYGRLQVIEDPDGLLKIVTRLTNKHESGRQSPWAVSDAPSDFIQAQLKGIIGFSLPLTRIEGKWKMSQNRPAADRAGVASGAAAEGRQDILDILTSINAETPESR